jgi:hypothetical protein
MNRSFAGLLFQWLKYNDKTMSRQWGRFSRWCAVLALFLTGCASARRDCTLSTAASGVAFAHGVLAFQEDRDLEAAQLFALAACHDPRDGTARHWLGLALLRQGRTEEAIRELEASLRAEHPPLAGRERVSADLALAYDLLQSPKPATAIAAPEGIPEVVPPVAALPRWEGRVGLDTGRDSNPGLLPDGLPFRLFGLTNAEADEEARLDGRVDLHPFYDRGGWTLGLSAGGSRSFHREQTDFDLTNVRATASLVWGHDPRGYLTGPLGFTRVPTGSGRLSLLVQAGASGVWLGGDSYLRTIEGTATFLGRESDRTATRVDVQAVDRRYADRNRSAFLADGSEMSVGVSQYVFLGRPDRYVRAGVWGGERGGGVLSDASLREVSTEAAVPLVPRWSVVLFGSRSEERYSHAASGLRGPAGPARNNRLWRASAAALWQPADRWQWTQRDSNIAFPPFASELLDYRRTIVSTGFNWFF